MKNVIVSGASGFIGSEIAAALHASGFNVTGLSRSNNEKLSLELGIKTQHIDLLSEVDFKLQPADVLIHCATANDVVSRNFCNGVDLSVNGTYRILKAAEKAGIQKIIYFSTAQVYGTELYGEYDENSAIKCETPYALNHFMGEELCKMYARSGALDIVVLRPSNVFGVPRANTVDRSNLVPFCFINEGLENNIITLRSSGKQVRNFISTTDLANLTATILQHFPKGFNLVNAGSNWSVTVLDILGIVTEEIQKQTQRSPVIRVQSVTPMVSNEFYYVSNFFPYEKPGSETREDMINTIRKITTKARRLQNE